MSRWLITATELAAIHDKGDVVIVDCRFALADTALGERQYASAHIPGAHYLHLDRDLSGVKGEHGGRHPLPTLENFAARMRALGVDGQTLVVAYDDNRFAFAARLWWLLRYCGHDRVRVLNGGYAAWCAAGLPTAAIVPAAAAGNFRAQPRPQMLVRREQVLALDERSVLVDSREEARFLGLEEPIDPVAGHIDGAVNRPWQQATDTAAALLAEAAQRQRWGAVADSEDIVVYCGSGVTACVNLLSLAEIGRDDARLYAGSWSDWCSYL